MRFVLIIELYQKQNKMILPYTAVFAAVFSFLIYQQHEQIILVLTLGISLLYYLQQQFQSPSQGLSKIAKGDFMYQICFIAWLYYYQIHYFMHYIPLLLSNVGKINWMVYQRNGETIITVQQLINFQNQCQAYVAFTLLLEAIIHAINGNLTYILRFFIYVIIIRLKYRFYLPTHKAYNQIHFFLDRISRRFKFRALYHLVYQGISFFSNDVYSPASPTDILY